MGHYHNPQIPISGLLNYIDAYNPRCYPGSGVNLTDLANLISEAGDSAASISAGNGISFGTSKNTYVSLTATIPNTTYTKMCWFNLADITTFQPLICGTNSLRHCMWMNKTAKLTASHSNTSAFSAPTFTSVAGTTDLSTNVWYFGAVTYSSVSGFNIYLNDRRDQTSVTTQTFGASNSQNYYGYYGDFFTSPVTPTLNGTLGPSLVFNRVLSAEEILKFYNSTKKRYGY